VLFSSVPDVTPYVHVVVTPGKFCCFGFRDSASETVVEGFPTSFLLHKFQRSKCYYL
jgi:hypothetical protein